MGEDPDPKRMPLELSIFPVEFQVAFFIYDLLQDVYEGMNGTFLGKNWAPIKDLLDIHEVDCPQETVYYIKMIEGTTVKHRAEESERQRKAADRKRQSSGKTYTHNVQG